MMVSYKKSLWPGFIIFSFFMFAGIVQGQFPVNNYDIYGVNLKTGEVFQISNIPDAGEFNPSWSNNSWQVAHDVVGGEAPFGHSIYITELKTGVSTLLKGAEGGNDAGWSPNGKTIVFDRLPVGDNSLYLVSALGGIPELIRENGADANWSPNSKQLVFSDFISDSIKTIDIKDKSETFVTSGAQPVWSPNGQWIAFVNEGDIWKIRVNMFGQPLGEPVNLTEDPGIYDWHPSWSNNSKTIVFHSDRSGDVDLWTISAEGGQPERLTGLAGYGDYDPSFSKNGRYVAYAGYTPIEDKKSIHADPNEISDSKFILYPSFPNPFNPAANIRYVLSEDGRIELSIYNTLGQKVAILVNKRQSAGEYQVQWQPQDLPSGIYILSFNTGEYQQIQKMVYMK